MKHRTTFLALTALLCASACSSSDTSAPATTAAPAAETTPPGTTPATIEDRCLYRTDMLLTADGALKGDQAEIDDKGLVLLTEPDDALLPNVDAATFADIDSKLDVYTVKEGSDPLAIAKSLSVEAAPVLVTEVSGHWTYAPGTPATPTSAPANPLTAGFANGEPSAIVGVVDTGYTETATTPAWLSSRAEPATGSNDDTSGEPVAGHGKFVASVVAEQNPAARIVVARMASIDNKLIHQPATDDEALPSDPTSFVVFDELQMFVGISHLLQTTDEYDVLNLSVGTYQCATLKTSGLAVLAALDFWYEKTSTGGRAPAPVVAAAGNHRIGAPAESGFIPGQLAPGFVTGPLVGVASVDSNTPALLSEFSNVASVTAPGEHLVGIRIDGQWDDWGGTSFATAIVSANTNRSNIPSPGTAVPRV